MCNLRKGGGARSRGACWIALLLLVSRSAAAQDDIEWRAPDECPSAATARAEVATLSQPHAATPPAVVVIERISRSLFQARVAVASAKDRREHVLRDSSCSVLTHAAALIVALAAGPAAASARGRKSERVPAQSGRVVVQPTAANGALGSLPTAASGAGDSQSTAARAAGASQPAAARAGVDSRRTAAQVASSSQSTAARSAGDSQSTAASAAGESPSTPAGAAGPSPPMAAESRRTAAPSASSSPPTASAVDSGFPSKAANEAAGSLSTAARAAVEARPGRAGGAVESQSAAARTASDSPRAAGGAASLQPMAARGAAGVQLKAVRSSADTKPQAADASDGSQPSAAVARGADQAASEPPVQKMFARDMIPARDRVSRSPLHDRPDIAHEHAAPSRSAEPDRRVKTARDHERGAAAEREADAGPVGGFVGLAAGISSGDLPLLAAAGELDAGLTYRDLRLGLRVGYAPSQRVELASPAGAGGRIALAHVAVEGGTSLFRGAVLEVPARVGLETGVLVGRGEGVPEKETRVAPWLSPYLSGGVSHTWAQRWRLALQLQGLLALLRPRFALDIEGFGPVVFHRPSLFAARVFFSFAWVIR